MKLNLFNTSFSHLPTTRVKTKPLQASASLTLTSQFLIAAPLEPVWQALTQPEQWPTWWRYVKRVTLLETGDKDDIGSLRQLVWGTALPYQIKLFIRTLIVEKPSVIIVSASGDLHGLGRWQLEPNPSNTTTRVTYTWSVRLEKPWMCWFAVCLKPIFAWNHHRVMHAGAQGLAQHLQTRLVSYQRLPNPLNRTRPPEELNS